MQKQLELNPEMTVEEVKKQAKEILIGQDVTSIGDLISPEHDYSVGYYGKDNSLIISISFSSSELKIPFSPPATLVKTTYLIKIFCEDGKMTRIKDVERWLTGL